MYDDDADADADDAEDDDHDEEELAGHNVTCTLHTYMYMSNFQSFLVTICIAVAAIGRGCTEKISWLRKGSELSS